MFFYDSMQLDAFFCICGQHENMCIKNNIEIKLKDAVVKLQRFLYSVVYIHVSIAIVYDRNHYFCLGPIP